MFVDTDLLRCGAEFSGSAGQTARRGAERFAATELTTGIFGDFDAAHGFQRALRRARQTHVSAMEAHGAGLEVLAEKANSAAAVFVRQDDANGSTLESAGLRFA
ncbi:DUF2563 family protein [Mycobacterium sp. SMC-4]|uniref:DUF2563 family protein n=1 Tax=Mycobacterium sp. SMC-4 TaxID=2857059 RepID=UPI003D08AAD9